MEIFEQNELTIYGNGKIIYEHHQGEAHFQIEYNPFSVILKTSRIILGQLFSMNCGKFEGLITDTQIKIECKKICPADSDKCNFILNPECCLTTDDKILKISFSEWGAVTAKGG